MDYHSRIDLQNFSDACKKEDFDLISELLMKNNFAINDHIIPSYATYWPGWTLLHMAARFGKLNLILWLLDQGANSSIRNKDGEIPLHIFLIHRNKYDIEFDDAMKIIGLLSGYKGKNYLCRDKNKQNALDIEFQLYNYVPKLFRENHWQNKILENIVSEMNNYGYYTYNLSRLHFECAKESECYFDYIQDDKKFLNQMIANKSPLWPGLRPLNIAILHNNKVAINWLLDNGASIKTMGQRLNSPLHTFWSTYRGNNNIDDYVLRLFDFENSNNSFRGCSHFDIACNLWPKTDNIVYKYIKDSHINDEDLPLDVALGKMSIEFVKLLIMHNADVNIRDLAQEYTGNWKHFEEHPDILCMLIEASKDSASIFDRNDARNKECDFSTPSTMLVVAPLHAQYLVKLSALGVDIKKKWTQWNPGFASDEFKQSCVTELEMLREENLVSLLYDNCYRYTRLVLNDDFKKKITDPSFEKRFPIYHTLIQCQYGKALLRRRLLNATKISFIRVFKVFKHLPDMCIEEILKNLSNDDLKNIIKADKKFISRNLKKLFKKLYPLVCTKKTDTDTDITITNASVDEVRDQMINDQILCDIM